MGVSSFCPVFAMKKTTATNILVIFDDYQLVSGFVCHVLESPDIPINYIDQGWIPHICRQLATMGGSMAVKHVLIPSPQLKGNNSIIEILADCKLLTKRDRLLLMNVDFESE